MRSYKIPGTALYIDNTLQIQCMARSPHSRRIDTTLCWSQHGHFSIDKKYFQNAQSPFFILLTPRSETRWVEYCFKDKLHHENMHMCVLLYKSWQEKPVICLHHQALYAEDIQIPWLSNERNVNT